MEKITLCPLPHLFSVCQVQEASNLPMGREYCFTACTKDEISLVCKTEDVPSITLQREDGWRCFYVQGVLDFSLIGILARISGLKCGPECQSVKNPAPLVHKSIASRLPFAG